METAITILLLLTLILVGFLVLHILKKEKQGGNDEENKEFLKQMNDLRKENSDNMRFMREEMEKQLTENRKLQFASSKDLNERLDNSAKVIQALNKQFGEVSETTKQVREIGKDISSLQDILRSPKLRGNFGEILLANLLEQMIPKENYDLQYTFKTGERVDAILRLKDGKMVSVDSKFPLEDFQRLTENIDENEHDRLKKALITQTKKHVDAIAKKYILPEENTLDFAFLYIPAENVYYELITSDANILDYAWKQHVILVSPNSFYAYLTTVLQGMRALQIEKNVQEILTKLAKLGVEFNKFGEDFRLVGTHLGRASNSYTSSEKRLDKIATNFEKTLGGEVEIKIEGAKTDEDD